MIRALYAGVAGLSNHQVKMDVIGNNIANANTYGFKQSRVTFAETLSQRESAAFAPHGRFGGVNPMEVGLGMRVASIDKNFNQGNLLATGITTDLAIQGEGFFVLTDGLKNYYSRAGGFQIDAQGNLVAQGGTYFIQGKMADENGVIASGTSIENLILPFGQKEPANATTTVDYFCNLNADSDPLQQTWASATGYQSFAAISSNLELSAANTLTVEDGVNDEFVIDIGDGTTYTVDLLFGASPPPSTTYSSNANLEDDLNLALAAAGLGGALEADINDETGYIRFMTQTGDDKTLTMTEGNGLLAELGITSSATASSEVTNSTLLNDMFIDGDQNALLTGNTVIFTGSEPDGTIVNGTFTYAEGDTVDELLAAINATYAGATATLGLNGKIILTDNFAGESSTTLNLNAGNNTIFQTSEFSELTEGRNAGSHSTSINVYDSLGNAHIVEVLFTKTSEENSWSWETIVDNGLITPTNGASGAITFNNDGSLASFSGGPLMFNPDGANTMTIALNPGNPGSFGGITQFDSPSTTIAVSQDGYAMGNLENIAIGIDGIISGNFSNGVIKTLGQIAIADFTNPAGLDNAGNNFYTESANSGDAVIGLAQTNFNSSINSGYLEMSNVDLTREFTELIVAQRGFQANARVIQTSDMILTEINSLKR